MASLPKVANVWNNGHLFLYHMGKVKNHPQESTNAIEILSNFWHKESFFGMCSKMQIIPIKNLNIKKVVP